MAIKGLLPGLELAGRQGQIEYLAHAAISASPSADASGHYALCAGTERLWGATFDPVGPGCGAEIKDASRSENFAGLETLSPWWIAEARSGAASSRASVRATTPDRLPLVGAAPDTAAIETAFAENPAQASWPALAGIYVAGGYGSRGFTWAPWAAGVIVSGLCSSPLPARLEAVRAVDPARQVVRRQKRR